MTPEQYGAAVLQKLGIRPTPGALKFMVAWARAEGGHTNGAKYNYYNTTMPEPGAGNTGTQGNIKVYRSWQQGIDATAATLKNGLYGGILSQLRRGDAMGAARALSASPWGTGALTEKVLAGGVQLSGAPVASYRPSGNTGTPGTVTTYKTTGVAPAARQQAALNYLADNSSDSLLNLASALSAGQATTTRRVTTPGSPGNQPATYLGGTKPGQLKQLTGTVDFEGKPVAAWIAPVLRYARKQGWQGSVNSGIRTYADQKRIWDSGVRPAARPGTSNHEGNVFPRGAVDVSDAQQLSNIILRSPYRHLLVYAGAKDPPHFSHPHNGSY